MRKLFCDNGQLIIHSCVFNVLVDGKHQLSLPLESAKGKKSLAVGDIRARRNPLNCKIKKFALNDRGKGEVFSVTLTQETCTQRDCMTLLVFFISWCIHIFFLLFYCVELNFYNLGGIRHGAKV